jgi:DNA-binding NarL/FixJ family response regulator
MWSREGPSRSTISVLLVDDQPLVRSGIAMLLSGEPDLVVVGQVGNGDDAMQMVRELRPDVVLMDVRMPGEDGVAVTRRLVDGGLAGGGAGLSRVLMLSTYNLDEAVCAALRAGALGFVLKEAAPQELIRAVRAVGSDDAWLDPAVTRRLIEDFASAADDQIPTPAMLQQLTPREREVTELIAYGLSNTELASRLHIGAATVKTHLNRILMKLQLRDRAQIVMVAYQTGLVKPGTHLSASTADHG